MLAVSATPSFSRVAKKLHAHDKNVLDEAIKAVLSNPQMCKKKGDQSGVFVHKFKLNNQESLLTHKLRPRKNAPTEAMQLAVGPHENFYAAFKR
jgi:hypothetical protein